MLNQSQIAFLTRVGKLDTYHCDGLVVGANNRQDRSACRMWDYKEFKAGMGLDDIRFDWLLTDKVYLAGGSVLNWIWGEKKNEDIDFFFTKSDTVDNFLGLITCYGFEETLQTKYARTMFHSEEKIIIQLVGNPGEEQIHGIFYPNEEMKFIAFDIPPNTISRFDLDICKFAVDGDKVYFTIGAVLDLLTMAIRATNKKKNTNERILKYNHKGFYISDKEGIVNGDRSDWF